MSKYLLSPQVAVIAIVIGLILGLLAQEIYPESRPAVRAWFGMSPDTIVFENAK